MSNFNTSHFSVLKVIEIFHYLLIEKDMVSDLNIPNGIMSNFVSFPLFGFTLFAKLRDFGFKGHQNTLIFFVK